MWFGDLLDRKQAFLDRKISKVPKLNIFHDFGEKFEIFLLFVFMLISSKYVAWGSFR